ncbi:hypothetical protein [Virgibacillus senegalensis]|uniref:hypothetical protein n=1 Tax=Virgibacillus senegalensis TaxID=1499679 RepID=UPI00069E4F27|nr:hypothetical protein [Virgibacillus senegalensis]
MNGIRNAGLLFLLLILLVGCTNNDEYNEALAEFYTEADTIFFISSFALSGYSNAWSNAIDNGENFSIAVGMQQSKFEDMANASDESLEEMSKNLNTLSEASKKHPEEYDEIYQECKALYATLSSIVEQVHNPSGSLLSFNQNVNDLTQEFKSKYEIIGALLSDEVKALIKQKEEEQEKEVVTEEAEDS